MEMFSRSLLFFKRRTDVTLRESQTQRDGEADGVGGERKGEVTGTHVQGREGMTATVSDPSFPSLDLIAFRGSLTYGFKKSDDVESMVKITTLLYNDERFSKGASKPGEKVSFFLYNLIDNMSEREVQAQEGKLQKYFSQLRTQNITITTSIFRGIRNLLDSYHTPELIKYVIALLDPKEQESHGSVAAPPPPVNGSDVKVFALENKLAELKAENKPIGNVLKQIIQALCAEENLQRALELKQQHEEEMTVRWLRQPPRPVLSP
ncbi:Leucine-rich PPR motif-containing protein, mitochondrial [Larimichthys crocea]|uniref:Uncharacterized protein n=1 Tax=Larimichthys crocea TaxID=215358 RepID=A0ACD3QBL7_LARCR|nr:Leucine-rich PPR motif-containing protein, mitochondrial [Larimichthys crocea]